MRRRTLLGLILVFCVASVAADKVRPLNIKLGLWEVKTTMMKDSFLKIPVETLEVLTPEQRTRLEERMNARYVGKTKSTTRKQCVNLDKLIKGTSFEEAGRFCGRNVLISTPTRFAARIECDIRGRKSEGTLEMDVLDPENVSGWSHLLSTRDNPINSTFTFTARWIAPACK